MAPLFDAAYRPCGSYDPGAVRAALEEALGQVTDFSWLRPGMTVALKVNLVTGAAPERAATTHPAVIGALGDILTERGADVIVGDSPGGPWSAGWVERIYRACGLTALEARGVKLNRDFSEVHVRDKDAVVCREYDLTGYLARADAVISVCKLKSHGMMTLSAGVKNLFGAVPGVKKPEYHFRFPDHGDFANMLVDICQHIHPVLTVCDAVVAMEGNGPTAGTPKAVGYLAAATDPHVLDESLARVIGLAPMAVPTLAAARDRGLLREDERIDGEPEPIGDFVIPQGSGLLFEGRGGAFGRLFSGILGKVLVTRPKLAPQACVGCGACRSVCPAGAITMKNGKPVIHRKVCIRCFCCQEFCPQGALHVHRSPVARLFNKEV